MIGALQTDAAGELGALAFSWLESEGGGRLLVDGALRLRWANGTARAWLARRRPIAAIEGHLCLGRATPELRKLLSRAMTRPEGLCVPVEEGSGHLVVCARLLGVDGLSSIFGMTLRRTDEATSESPSALAHAFGLTAAETTILQLLLGGDTANDAARQLGVSVETVRTHIRRIYQKVGVSSREALLNQARPFMLAL